MQTFFYNLSGGINQTESKTALGLDNKRLYWTDSQNMEILKNTGIVRQNGNVLLFNLAAQEKIIGMHQLQDEDGTLNLLVATALGNIYVYLSKSSTIQKINKTISGTSRVNFVDYLDGVVVGSKDDALFYINNDVGYAVESCNLKDSHGNPIPSGIISVFAGRVWVGHNATLYFSALGKYNDFTTANDAGYINNFYNDTNTVTALKTYKNYLAIYKENSVYLLSGISYDDFAIAPFADKGTKSFSGVINVNNKQYFINQSVFAMEQAGLLSQIQLGEEISLIIKDEFQNFDKTRFDEIIILEYQLKNQVWFFIPYQNDEFFHTVWIFDYVNNAWFKRKIPQEITSAGLLGDKIVTSDKNGYVYQEDFGNTFNGDAIEFMWKSPFLSPGNPDERKTIDEFYFLLDENYDNNFNFSVYKDYDDKYKDDEDSIFSTDSESLIWYGDNVNSKLDCSWNKDVGDINGEAVASFWATGSNSIYKAEISESNYSVMLCVEGTSVAQNAAIIGLDFKVVYRDE